VKLPFTCSVLPGRTPLWMILGLFGLLQLLVLVHGALLWILYRAEVFVAAVVVMAAVWARMRRDRRDGWADVRLKYEEVPDPEIHGLNLLR